MRRKQVPVVQTMFHRSRTECAHSLMERYQARDPGLKSGVEPFGGATSKSASPKFVSSNKSGRLTPNYVDKCLTKTDKFALTDPLDL